MRNCGTRNVKSLRNKKLKCGTIAERKTKMRNGCGINNKKKFKNRLSHIEANRKNKRRQEIQKPENKGYRFKIVLGIDNPISIKSYRLTLIDEKQV